MSLLRKPSSKKSLRHILNSSFDIVKIYRAQLLLSHKRSDNFSSPGSFMNSTTLWKFSGTVHFSQARKNRIFKIFSITAQFLLNSCFYVSGLTFYTRQRLFINTLFVVNCLNFYLSCQCHALGGGGFMEL